ncbi:MAG: hypothetical protein HYU67_00435 [Flavobacteriia bacterium]|nr:hypothetical protein [Flavobacteriia bacterium]
MAKAHFQGTFNRGKYLINIGLSLYLWEEDNITFVYSPALDITGYGMDEKEAKHSFEITLKEFVDYTHNKNTIFDELENLGWTVNRKKKRIHAPDIEELKIDNDTFRNILKRGNVRQENKNIELALA